MIPQIHEDVSILPIPPEPWVSSHHIKTSTLQFLLRPSSPCSSLLERNERWVSPCKPWDIPLASTALSFGPGGLRTSRGAVICVFGVMSKRSKSFQKGSCSVGTSQIPFPSPGKLRQLLQAAGQGGLAQLRGDPEPAVSPALCNSCADTQKLGSAGLGLPLCRQESDERALLGMGCLGKVFGKAVFWMGSV